MLSLIDWLMAPVTAVLLFFVNGGQQFPDVIVDADIPYTAQAGTLQKNTLDIYRTPKAIDTGTPENAAGLPSQRGLFPVLLFIHGGGLLIGDKSEFATLGNKFASLGFTTVIANHRLSPHVSHPEHNKDIASAFAWVHNNINK